MRYHRVTSDFIDYPFIYYFVTNIQSSSFLFDDDADTPSRDVIPVVKKLFTEILGLPHDQDHDFAIGSAQSMVQGALEPVCTAIRELINTPTDYYLIAREGRLEVVPSIGHGFYYAAVSKTKEIGAAEKGFSASLTSSLSKYQLFRTPAIDEFEYLINSDRTCEADLQRFFLDNPEFLYSIDERYCQVRPHVCLIDKYDNKMIPDFLIRIEDTSIWDLVELKLPRHAIVLSKADSMCVSAAVAKGVSQLLRYRDYFAIKANRSRILSKFNICSYEPALVLVVGRASGGRYYEWESIKSRYPKVKVVPYDFLLERAKQMKQVAGGVRG